MSAQDDSYVLADLGTRPATGILECDVKLDAEGCAGIAFGGDRMDGTWTALCLGAANGLLHYEGTLIDELSLYDSEAYTRFDFSRTDLHHIRLVFENEIVVLYVDDTKALSSRIRHSINGAHIGLFSAEGDAVFSDVKMRTLKKD